MSKRDKFIKNAKPIQWMDDAKWLVDNDQWQDDASRIAVRILQALKSKKMSQKSFAQRLGVSPQAITKIVKGRQNLTIGTLRKIEDALSIELFRIPTITENLIPMRGGRANVNFSQSKEVFSGHISEVSSNPPSESSNGKIIPIRLGA